jgi:hypothetical protein
MSRIVIDVTPSGVSYETMGGLSLGDVCVALDLAKMATLSQIVGTSAGRPPQPDKATSAGIRAPGFVVRKADNAG